MRRWLLLACPGAASMAQLQDGHLLTDSPTLRAYLRGSARCTAGVGAARRVNDGASTVRLRMVSCRDHRFRRPGACAAKKAQGQCGDKVWGCDHTCGKCAPQTDNGLITTRSWDTSFATKLRAFADMVVASRSTVAYLGSSSFAVPMVARSMCLARIYRLSHESSPCPNFSRLYHRGLFGVTWGSIVLQDFESQTKPALAAWHPCKQAKVTSCIDRYIASVAGCTVGAAHTALIHGLVPPWKAHGANPTFYRSLARHSEGSWQRRLASRA